MHTKPHAMSMANGLCGLNGLNERKAPWILPTGAPRAFTGRTDGRMMLIRMLIQMLILMLIWMLLQMLILSI